MFPFAQSHEVNFTTIPIDYVQVVIDYLYDANAERLLAKKYSESFISVMIALTDQLFMDGLKEIFQILILRRLTTKRCGEWLEFAVQYNCEVMKSTIFDYICYNLREVLEHRYLDNVDPGCLKELSARYKELFPTMANRIITPRSDFSDEYVENFVKGFKVDFETDPTPTKAAAKSPKEPKSGTKTKADYEKIGKLSLLKEERNADNQSKVAAKPPTKMDAETQQMINEIIQVTDQMWKKVETAKRTDVKGKLLLNANEVLKNEDKLPEQMVNLKIALNTSKGDITGGPANEGGELAQSPSQSRMSLGDFIVAGSTEKMSQKQRKRSARMSEGDAAMSAASVSIKAVENPWSIPEKDTVVDVLDLSGQRNRSSTRETNSSTPTSGTSSGTSVSPLAKMDFEAIQRDEQQEKAYFEKLKTKPLKLTQMEEKAIKSLEVLYNVEHVFDEEIVVERKVRQQPPNQSQLQWSSAAAASPPKK